MRDASHSSDSGAFDDRVCAISCCVGDACPVGAAKPSLDRRPRTGPILSDRIFRARQTFWSGRLRTLDFAIVASRILDEEFFDARFTHRSHFGSAGNPIRRLRPTGQSDLLADLLVDLLAAWWAQKALPRPGATTPFAWVAIWVTHSRRARSRAPPEALSRPARSFGVGLPWTGCRKMYASRRERTE